ncbi:La-related protein 6C [Linum perenne]
MAQANSDKNSIHRQTSSNKEMMMTAMMKENAKPPPITPTADSNSSTTTTAPPAASSSSSSSGGLPFKFNAQAPEFVPRSNSSSSSSSQQISPISGYFYPCFHYMGASGGSDWFFLGDQDPSSPAAAAAAATYLISNPNLGLPSKDLTDDLRQRIVKQAEYQFSDMSLLANESMSKHLGKDPEGYVPIYVIASTKKMKSLTSNHHLITQALRTSPKLVVSEDGRKVKRKIHFTEKDRDDLQSRTVVVENLPDDHSHQNLEKIFGVVGSVKTIRICHPQESTSSRSKSDFFMSNKVEKLNDERNWRKGLRVRMLYRCSPKSVLKNRKSEFEGILDDEEGTFSDSLDDISIPNTADFASPLQADENPGSSRKGSTRGGRGKGRGGRLLISHGSGNSASSSSMNDQAGFGKHAFKGPRMPDGTRGFAMGRGKPLASPVASAAMVE